MSEKIHSTKHAKERALQRLGDGRVLTAALTKAAFGQGKEFSQFKGALHSYLRSKISGDGHYVAKVYDDYVWVFENSYGHRLITVYKLPEECSPSSSFLVAPADYEPKCILLTNKKTGDVRYWSATKGMTDDICEALEFNNQIKAANYLANDKVLRGYSADWDIDLF